MIRGISPASASIASTISTGTRKAWASSSAGSGMASSTPRKRGRPSATSTITIAASAGASTRKPPGGSVSTRVVTPPSAIAAT